jgi:dolichyl-phosphate-mannose-protein mannosyltransferase
MVETVMLAAFRRGLGSTGDISAPIDPVDQRPGETTLTPVLRLPRGKHSSGPLKFSTESRRRTWVSRAVLFAILCVQAALTLRMHNTAFEDEALYLYSGHLEIAHWLHGTALQGNYATYFSSAPVLYPVLGAAADITGGLGAARAVSLLAMLTTTGLLYSLTRRIFNERVALCATVIFSVTEPALFLGNLATYDAPALCLLAIAAWIVVRTAAFRWPVYLLAALPVTVAVATKYASALFVPTIVLLSALAAWPYRGRKALIPPAALTAVIAGLLAAALHFAGQSYLTGIRFTTTARFPGSTPTQVLLHDSVKWGALPFALAVFGAIAYAVRPRTEPGELIAPAGGRLRRIALGAVLTGTALLAPADQIHTHTLTSLWKHIGFGLFFAAPFAGVGLARIVGDHFRRAQVGIAIWGAALVLGMTQAGDLFSAWPSSTAFVSQMSRYLRPHAQLPGRGGRGPHLLPAPAPGRPAGPVHFHLLHRLPHQAGPVPDRKRGLRGRDQGRVLPGRRLRRPGHARSGRRAGGHAARRSRLPAGRVDPGQRRRRHLLPVGPPARQAAVRAGRQRAGK